MPQAQVFVIDASVVASWAFPDEGGTAAQAAYDLLGEEPAIAPALIWHESHNVLLTGEKRGRITPSQTAAFLKLVALLPITADHEPDETAVLALARDHNLSVYDAAYLELALRKGVALASLDTALVQASAKAGVPLIG